MTASETTAKPGVSTPPARRHRRRRPRPDHGTSKISEAAPLPPRRPWYAGGGGLMILAILLVAVVFSITVLSGLENRASQQSAYDQLRESLAQGTAPVSAIDTSGKLIADGTPIAFIAIPAIRLRQTLLFGTSPTVLMDGPGLRRDSVIPGQSGTAVVMGRAWSYGGAFGDISSIPVGSAITVTTAQGEVTYKTIDTARYAGDLAPQPVAAGGGRLVLTSAYGTPFVPTGTVRIDADLVSAAHPTPPHLSSSILGSTEQAMATDNSGAWALVLLLQLLLVVTVAALVAWYRWGRMQTWLIFTPVILWVGLSVSDQLARFVPNLL